MMCCRRRQDSDTEDPPYGFTTSSDMLPEAATVVSTVKPYGYTSQNEEMIENQPMYITEPYGGKSWRTRSQVTSLSTIFSSMEDNVLSSAEHKIGTQAKSVTKDVTNSLPSDPRLADASVSHKNYYTLTWVTPEAPDLAQVEGVKGGDVARGPSANSSMSSKSKAMDAHPVTRLRVLRSSGSTTSGKQRGSSPVTSSPAVYLRKGGGVSSCEGVNVSRTVAKTRSNTQSSADRQAKGAELSHIPEASSDEDFPVFETPENNNAYYPNPNTPATAYEESGASIFGFDNPYCPPNNTPVQTLSSNDTSNLHMMNAVWADPSSSGELHMEESEASIFINYMTPHSLLEMRQEQVKLQLGSEALFNSPVGEIKSLSIHSTDLNSTAVPIHCSTIDGATEKHGLASTSSSSQPATDGIHVNSSLAATCDKLSQTARQSCCKGRSVGMSEEETVTCWHYNKAYVNSSHDILNVTEPLVADIISAESSSSDNLNRDSTADSQTNMTSRRTSVCVQVGSTCSSFCLPSDQTQYASTKAISAQSVFTDSASNMFRPIRARVSSSTFAFSEVNVRSFDSIITKMSHSVEQSNKAVQKLESYSLSKSGHRRKHISSLLANGQETGDMMEQPLLSAEVHWV